MNMVEIAGIVGAIIGFACGVTVTVGLVAIFL